MNRLTHMCRGWVWVPGLLLWAACQPTEKPKDTDIVQKPERFEVRVSKNLRSALDFILNNKGRLNDTVVLDRDTLVHALYQLKDFQPIWCSQEKFLPLGDSLYLFIQQAEQFGLFPSDYHLRALSGVRSMIDNDSLARKDAALWSRADLMLTDAFHLLCQHLKQGRLDYDSTTLRKDTVLTDSFYTTVFKQVQATGHVFATFRELEPKQQEYVSLKSGLKSFLDSIGSFRRYTPVVYPNKDSAALYNALQRRLFEEDVVASPTEVLDTTAWRLAISHYQETNGLKVTGKINSTTVNLLNNTTWEKFKRVAINMDRYKLLPDSMPETYVWVNIPSYYLKVYDSNEVVMESRVIVGQPKTRTPVLTSQISNFITFPQWTVPYSIIFKEMLPQIQKSTAYLAKQNLMVVDKNDSIIHPDSINWKKLSKKYFPYLLKQRQGDDNSLGVMKFNFPNKYSVYLHDTNARWLFSRSGRALSHGCVRVKDFQKLADFLVRNEEDRFPTDTIRNWIKRQEKHVVSGFKRVPVYIRYFTCEGKDGRLVFYDDIYGEDKLLRERYFADKAIL